MDNKDKELRVLIPKEVLRSVKAYLPNHGQLSHVTRALLLAFVRRMDEGDSHSFLVSILNKPDTIEVTHNGESKESESLSDFLTLP